MSRNSRVPANGIGIFCGLIYDETNREKKILIPLTPPCAIRSPEYVCDRRFHVDSLREMLSPKERFGYVVIGGRRCVIGIVSGEVQRIVEAFSVDIPSKHGMGGQSAVRFQRLSEEARHNLVRRVAESTKRRFLSDGIPNVTGIVLAGCAQLKNQLQSSELLGDQLQSLVMGTVQVSYDGEQGFAEAVKRTRKMLGEVESVREQAAIERLFEAAAKGQNCALGLRETMAAWECNAIEVLYVSKELKLERAVTEGGEVVYCEHEQGIPGLTERGLLIDWIVDHYKELGCELQLVGSGSPEGTQFARGIGGIGALLRFPIVVMKEEQVDEFDSDFDL
jgi:peptide chain release factor subunit 1